MAESSATGPLRRPSALVFGGSGTVGAAVVRGLKEAGVPTVFTYFRGRERALELQGDGEGARAVALNLADSSAIRTVLRALAETGAPNVLIHCAAVSKAAPLGELTDEDWEAAHAINCRSVFVACQELAPHMARAGGGDIVLLGALDRAQSLPLPVPFAATQGMLATMTMALSKELGKDNTKINMVSLSVLEGGLSQGLSARHLGDYKRLSAMHRLGTAKEVAKVVLWLALKNSYMTGKVLPVNGGI